jgi:hypothetical protein
VLPWSSISFFFATHADEPNVIPLLDEASIDLNSYAAARTAAQQVAPTPSAPPAKRAHKPRWHFGIRSRSPPMEVMLEIYRTLKSLGMEWRRKPEIIPSSEGSAGGSGGKPGKRDHAAEEKLAQGLFFVETRCRVRDIVVRLFSVVFSLLSVISV